MNPQPHQPPMKQRLRFWRWVWAAILLSVLVCALIAWLYHQQRLVLERSIMTLDTLRQARIDLAEGFLVTVLASDGSALFDAAEGLVQINQALIALDGSIELLQPDRVSMHMFQQDLQRFRDDLLVWQASRNPQLMIELIVALNRLERAADQVDTQIRADLRQQSAQLNRIFVGVLIGAVFLLAAICSGVLILERQAHAADRALRASELRQQLALDAGELGTWQWDPATKQVTLDPTSQHLIDIATMALTDRRDIFLARLHPEDRERTFAALQNSLEQRSRLELQFRWYLTDGSLRWLYCIGQPLLTVAQPLPHFYGIVADITARKQTEAELLQMNATLEQRVAERTAELQARIIERDKLESELQRQAERATGRAELSHLLAEVALDEKRVFTVATRHVATLFGDTSLIALTQTNQHLLDSLQHYYYATAADPQLEAQLNTRTCPIGTNLIKQVTEAGQLLYLNPDQTLELCPYWKREPADACACCHPAQTLALPLRAQGQILGVLALMRDPARPSYTADEQLFLQSLADHIGLTIDNLCLFRAAEQARTEAERANQAKSAFLAMMSHELRTPLNAILGYSESLSEGIYGALNKRQLTSIQNIERSGRHLLALINDILDLAKVEANQLTLQFEPIALGEICQASLIFVREQALKKQLHLELQLPTEDRLINADLIRLKQILVNLLANAVKFTPPGGTVTLEAMADEQANQVHFIVHDTGIGIAEADYARLFQPFSQIETALSRTFEGTGLGLALVQRLVALHGGTVTVTSAAGQGSHFMVTLPLNQPAQLLDTRV